MLYFLLSLVSVASKTELVSGECEDDIFCTQYALALSIAKTPSAEKIVRNLTPIRNSNPNLTFDAESRVLLASSDIISHYPYTAGEKFELLEDTWFTATPDLKNACKRYPNLNKTYRMKQQLGLPPSERLTGVVELFVSLSDIFRPCADPEISDMECQVSIPISNTNTTDPEVPWYCPSENEEIIQTGAAWAIVAKAQFVWMCENWKVSYLNEQIYENYPWTGLGYTYDWGKEDGIGLSEFVVPKGTTVVFHSKKSVDEYCLL